MSNSKNYFFFHAKSHYSVSEKKNQAEQRWELRNGQNIIGTCPTRQTNAIHHDLKIKVTLQG